jgi:hypothetical protein
MSIDYKEMCLKSDPPTEQDAVKDLIGNDGWYIENDVVKFNPDFPNPIAKSTIDIKLLELKDIYLYHSYLRLRQAALSQKTTEEQFEMIYLDKVNNTELWKEWRDHINSIYPKPIDSLF